MRPLRMRGSTRSATRTARSLRLEPLERRDAPAADFSNAFTFGGTGVEQIQWATTDGNGLVVVTGRFQGTVDFDPGPGTTNLTAVGGDDFFVAKYTATGTLVWARGIGGDFADEGVSVAVDAAGNVLTTGTFTGTVDFDPGAGTTTLTAATNAIFVSKLDASGNFVWARAFGANTSFGVNGARAIDSDRQSNVYVGGVFGLAADFDPGAATLTLTPSGPNDAFLIKLDSAGTLSYVHQIGGTGPDQINGVAVHRDFSTPIVYVGGTFSGTVDFDPSASTTTRTSVAGSPDAFVARFDANTGGFGWVSTAGGPGPDFANTIAYEAEGFNVVAVGEFQATADFDPGAGTTNLTSAGSSDAFAWRLAATGGDLIWARAVGGTAPDRATGVVTDRTGVTVTGDFQGSGDFDPTAGVTTLTSAGGPDAFAVRLTQAGTFDYAGRFGGAGFDNPRGVAGPGGVTTFVGGFLGSADLDPFAGTATFNSAGGLDAYFVTVSQTSAPPFPVTAGNPFNFIGLTSDEGVKVVSDAAGNLYVVGYFTGAIDFAPGSAVSVLAAVGGTDNSFVAKYSPTGALVWARAFPLEDIGGGGSSGIKNLVVDAAGNVYLTGAFRNAVDFDPGPGVFTLTTTGTAVVAVKLDANGNFAWATSAGNTSGTQNVGGFAVAVDPAGTVSVVGYFVGTVDFDPGPGTNTLTAIGGGFVWRLDTAGTYQSVSTFGNNTIVEAATRDPFGNIIITGRFSAAGDYNPGPGTFTLTPGNSGIQDIFVVKLTASGGFVWADRFGSPASVTAHQVGQVVATDAAGNVYVGGRFVGTTDFDPGPDVVNRTATGLYDMFLLKLTPAGEFGWVRTYGAASLPNQVNDLVADPAGNVYAIGTYAGTIDFDPGPGTTTLTASVSDAFVLELTAAGDFRAVQTLTGGGNERGSAIAFAGPNTVALTGSFINTVDFDPGPGTLSASAGSSNDFFLTKFTVTPQTAAPAPTVTLTSPTPAITNANPIPVTVTFSEPVTDFTAADLVATNATVTGFTGTGAGYSFGLVPAGPGTVTVQVPAAAALNGGGIGNEPSNVLSRTFDGTGPTVTLNQAAGQTDPTTAAPIQFTVVFSEAVTGFDGTDVSFAGSTAPGTLTAAVSGSGTTYTVGVSGMTGTGLVRASLVAGAATDAAGNASAASTSTDNTVAFDDGPPTVTINQTGGQADPTGAAPISFTVVFSEPVTGFDGADISFAGGTAPGMLVAAVSGSGTTYTVSVSGMTGSGTVVASVAAGAAVDGVGQPSAASTSTDNSVTFDNTPPAVTIDQAAAQPDPAGTVSIQFTVVFSEPVLGFDGADISFAGSTAPGMLTAAVTGSGTTFTVSVNGLSGPGTVVVGVVAGAATDAVGNLSLASTSTDNTVTFAPAAPAVTINQSAGQADPTGASPISFTVVFSEPVTGFDGSDIEFTGTTAPGMLVAAVSGSGTTYTVSVSGMTVGGAVVAIIPAGAAVGAFSNPNAASTSTDNTVTFDADGPAVTINQGAAQADPTSAGPVLFTVTFSEPVTGFDGADVTFAGSSVSGTLTAAVSGSGTTYTVSVSGMTGSGTVAAGVRSGAAIDAAGNASTASTSTDNAVTFDVDGPTVTINQAASQSDPTNAGPITFTVVFSEPVTGFTAADVTFVGSTAPGTLTATVSGSGTTYTVAVSGMSGSGNVVAGVLAGAVADALGNPSAASTSTDNAVTFDTVRPAVTINKAAGQADPTNGSPVLFTVVFSEPVTGFTAADVSFAGSTVGGTLTAAVSGSGTTYTVSVGGMTGSGNVVVGIPANAATDAAGNPSTASTSTDNTVGFDSVGPMVTVIQAATQSDPTNTGPVAFTVIFSEPATGFTGADVSFAGSTVGGTLTAAVVGSGTTYTVMVGGMTGSGTVIASIPAGAAADAVGNPNAASTGADNTVTFDQLGPAVTIDQAAGQADPTGAAPVLFTVVFGEPVTGFTAADVSLAGSTAPGVLTVTVSGSGTTYTVAVSGMTGPGTVIATVLPGTAQDAAGNLSLASTSTDSSVAFENVAPTATVTLASGQADPTAGTPIRFAVVFSEPVTGFDASDVILGGTAGGTPTAVVSGSGANYSVDVAGMTSPGTVTVRVGAAAAADAAGNGNTASATTAVAFDNQGPTATVEPAAGQSDPTPVGPIDFVVTFSEPVTGFTTADIDFSNSTAGGALVATVTGGGASYTVRVTGMTGPNTVVVTLPPGAAVDALGNGSAAAIGAVTFAPAPTAVLASPAADPTPTGPIPVTVTFSEPVTGFDATDLVPANATATDFAGSGTSYTFNLVPAAAGVVSVSVPAGAAVGVLGVGSAAAGPLSRTFAPPVGVTVALASPAADPTNVSAIPVTVTFSEPVTGFDASDLVLTNAAVTDFAGSGASYTFNLVPQSQGAASVAVPAGVAAGAGGANAASAPLTRTFDNLTPTAAVAVAPGQVNPALGGPVAFAVTFSEPVVGFAAGGVVVGGTAGGPRAVSVSGSGASYTVVVDGVTSPGTVTLAVAAGAVSDAAGNAVAATSPAAVTVLRLAPLVAGGPADGSAVVYTPTAPGQYAGPAGVQSPFRGLGVNVRVATADVDGDGFNDTVLVTGPGTPGRFAVVSGRDNATLLVAPTDPYGDAGGFPAGGFVVAGDLNGDGRAEVVITPDIKGGPRVIVARLEADGTVSFPYSFIGIQDEAFRDGARAALGDFNGDGATDIAVIAALNGGPRTAIFDGRPVASGTPGQPPKLLGDFFATKSAADEGRGGRYLAAGDLNGDGFADLIVTGDPTIGGGAQVTSFSGADLAAGRVVGTAVVADFAAGGIDPAGGVRVATTNLDGDARAELVVGSGAGQPGRVKVYRGADIVPGGEPASFALDPFGGGVLTDGIFIG